MKPESFHPLLREGALEKSKFKRDNLESQSLGNQLKGNPEVLLRLSHQAGSKETSVSAANCTTRKGQPGNVDWKSEIRKEITEYTETTLRSGKQTGTQNELPESLCRSKLN